MLNTSPSRFRYAGSRYSLGIAVCIIAALLALPLFIGSAVSPIRPIDNDNHVQSAIPANSHSTIAASTFNFLNPLPQAAGPTVETFAGDCTTPKSVFNLQDADLTVCAKFTQAQIGWQLIWSNANSIAVQTVPLTTQHGSATFTLNANSSLGDWRVILYEPFGGSVQAVTRFTVVDAANPKADVSVSKNLISTSASAGHQILYSIEVSNDGPSDAAAVTLADDVPANTTFHSFGQLAGPTFNCTNPSEGEVGTTNCTIASLGRGETAVFIATYVVDTVSNGTIISNTASVSSTTDDPNTDNNTETASATVVNAACVLSTPDNIT